jgi:hypothetical protein
VSHRFERSYACPGCGAITMGSWLADGSKWDTCEDCRDALLAVTRLEVLEADRLLVGQVELLSLEDAK